MWNSLRVGSTYDKDAKHIKWGFAKHFWGIIVLDSTVNDWDCAFLSENVG